MTYGLAILALSYVLSQFFRAFLAVLTTPLGDELGIGPDVLATASGYWFLVFAAMQIPVGWALDTLGPRRTAGWLFLAGGGGGAALFALAQSATHIHIAMGLIGMGCAPVLMASFYIFAREFDGARFATLAALMIGIGTIGNLISSYPLALAVETIGWRNAMWGLAGLSSLVALGVLATVRDPAKITDNPGGSFLDVLRIPALWLLFPIMFVNYTPVAAIRGMWISPYLRDVFDMPLTQVGLGILVMSLAMIVGTLTYGPLDRLLGTRKWVVVGGNGMTLALLFVLIWQVDGGAWTSVALMAGIGFFGATFPVIIAHARSFVPPHLVGRGVTLMNLFGIGGVGVMQFASSKIYGMTSGANTTTPYIAIFSFFAAALLAGVLIYALSRDSRD